MSIYDCNGTDLLILIIWPSTCFSFMDSIASFVQMLRPRTLRSSICRQCSTGPPAQIDKSIQCLTVQFSDSRTRYIKFANTTASYRYIYPSQRLHCIIFLLVKLSIIVLLYLGFIDFKCQITLITFRATLICESNLLLDL